MAVMVTIEGSNTPSVVLAKGVRRTVRLTDRVQRLIARGYVVVISEETPRQAKRRESVAAASRRITEAAAAIESGTAQPEPEVTPRRKFKSDPDGA